MWLAKQTCIMQGTNITAFGLHSIVTSDKSVTYQATHTYTPSHVHRPSPTHYDDIPVHLTHYYMYRQLYCYTLNRSVFIKWEGKVYINYLYTQFLSKRPSLLSAFSKSINTSNYPHSHIQFLHHQIQMPSTPQIYMHASHEVCKALQLRDDHTKPAMSLLFELLLKLFVMLAVSH